MSYSVFPEVFLLTVFSFVYIYSASVSGKGKSKNGFRIKCTAALALYGVWLLWMALIARSGNNQRELILTPLSSVKTVLTIYNSFDVFKLIVDNILVFVPFGMLLPVAAGKTPCGKNFAVTTLCGALASVAIEALQYVFSLGFTEADDVIYNTAGCMIGAGIFALSGKAESKNGSFTLKKGWFACLLPMIICSAILFAFWAYREYVLFKK